ncbi:MAG: GNAT family N-acetyltransferase [Pseudomonadota bacterium]
MDIDFIPVREKHLSLINSWMALPHWREWWGDPEVELGYIKNMLEGHDPTKPFLFLLDQEPAGYIQYWRVKDAKAPPWNVMSPWVMDIDETTIGVDLSIGPANQLSKGLGTAVLAAFVMLLRNEGFTKIIIDPDVRNKRAIRAYEKAGFIPIRTAKEQDGSVLLMEWKGNPDP